VRGFSQNELGSLIYISTVVRHDDLEFYTVNDPVLGSYEAVRDTFPAIRRVVPVGGNTLVVGNLELRLRSPFAPQLLQWTVFTDAGEVWNRGSAGALSGVKLKVTPGIQMTAFSPVGPVRIAVGYNPYRRPAGPRYYEATNEGGELICVSPGNDFPTTVTADPITGGDIIRQTGKNPGEVPKCPASFQPAKDNGFFKKLTFSFAIGQAF
jgi:outer membrane protein insertion porin family/translocation and assembly module TamA